MNLTIKADQLRARYEALLEEVFGGIVSEGRDRALPPELELQSQWFAGAFGEQFRTLDGREVKIRDFGYWNRSAGPDFREASIEIDGEIRNGDIELDPDVRDWERHGHAMNPDFEDVVLHLFFRAPAERVFTRTLAHGEVPQVLLNADDLIGRRRDPLAEARIGRCATPLAEHDLESIDDLMVAAARYRMSLKTKEMSRVARLHGEDEALYQGIAEALGYRPNKLPMRVLAQRLPLRQLRTRSSEAESLLFGVAGFLEGDVYERGDDETKAYLRGLWEGWWGERGDRTLRQDLTWIKAAGRPGNHPERRVGGLTAVVREWRGLEAQLESFDPKGLITWFTQLTDSYWAKHYTLRSAPAARPISLVGESRATEILVNQVLPFVMRSRPEIWESYLKIPTKLSNQKVRRASLRLLGHRSDAKLFEKFAYQQQALLQLHDDFCLADDSGCEECPFPERLKSW